MPSSDQQVFPRLLCAWQPADVLRILRRARTLRGHQASPNPLATTPVKLLSVLCKNANIKSPTTAKVDLVRLDMLKKSLPWRSPMKAWRTLLFVFEARTARRRIVSEWRTKPTPTNCQDDSHGATCIFAYQHVHLKFRKASCDASDLARTTSMRRMAGAQRQPDAMLHPRASNTQQVTSKFKAKFSETRQILSPTKAPMLSMLCLGGLCLSLSPAQHHTK